MSRLSLAPRHDPYWDMDGVAARRNRVRRRIVRFATWLLILTIVALAAIHLPEMDAEYLLRGEGRPVMAAGLLGLLGSAAILALARIRQTTHE